MCHQQSNRRGIKIQSDDYSYAKCKEKTAYYPRTEKGYLTQSWHTTNGFLEEVILKREKRSVGSGGREEKAQEGGGMCGRRAAGQC